MAPDGARKPPTIAPRREAAPDTERWKAEVAIVMKQQIEDRNSMLVLQWRKY